MRYLGIDYGAKRIGLALSDSEGSIAFPHATVGSVEEVVEVISREGVERVIIGLPLTLHGKESDESARVRQFVSELSKRVQLPIAFENEVFTTKLAERHTPREKADASAAALILQSYLDRENPKS